MASIAACVEGLQRRIRPENSGELDDLPEYLEIIRKATYRCKSTAEKLLSFSRQAAPILESVNVNDAVREVLSLVDHEAGLEGKQVTMQLDPDILSISGDKAQLGQLLLNLILNGLDAIDGTGTVTVTTSRAGESVQITVTDTGCGIPEEHLTRIFEPFFTTKAVGKGTGLGLSICESIVRRHGGTIEVTSRVGAGSAFTITFPAVTDESRGVVALSTEGRISGG